MNTLSSPARTGQSMSVQRLAAFAAMAMMSAPAMGQDAFVVRSDPYAPRGPWFDPPRRHRSRAKKRGGNPAGTKLGKKAAKGTLTKCSIR